MPVAERPAPRRCVILHDTPLFVGSMGQSGCRIEGSGFVEGLWV
jgi:hypothetical protein